MAYNQNYGGQQQYGGQPQGNYGGPPQQQQYGNQQYAPQQGQGGYNQQQGGYGGQQQYGAPPQGNRPPPPAGNVDPEIAQWFQTVDRDGSGHINVQELSAALRNGDWSEFDVDTVKLLMSLFDTDRSGTINCQEFSGVWKYINQWKGVFSHFDRDRSGTIEGAELGQAMASFGFPLNPQLLDMLQRKYATPNSRQSAPGGFGMPPRAGGVTFDRFIQCCVVVKQLTEAFRKQDPQGRGSITMTYDQFMSTVLAAP